MYSLIALLAGASAKLYDDIEDNNFLQKFHNNTLMEFLKGIHYISFTATSIKEPNFFIVFYVVALLNRFIDKIAWVNPYERSLLYSFLLLFIIIDYKKIKSFCLSDKLLILICLLSLIFEPKIIKYLCKNSNSEYSFIKLILRCFNTLFSIIMYFFSKSNTLKYLMAYNIAYMFMSVLVQCYSLIMEKLKIKEKEEIKEKEKKEEIKEIKEVKEIKVKEIEEIEKEVVKVKEIEEKQEKKEK